ncbi:hypothetical protein L915_04223 [Phytophthora nicotianae]|uniref:Uncharacterized protein n=1 Tax=Phytophthora nicotianae TaxID=4792 RepID=W2JJM4_PHYNI|nr:hypothetical protein L915_04223 [Phytophthora nicotianae]ETL45798.1 hypothetical protein L916_04173 [Phytophthora nicotianae]
MVLHNILLDTKDDTVFEEEGTCTGTDDDEAMSSNVLDATVFFLDQLLRAGAIQFWISLNHLILFSVLASYFRQINSSSYCRLLGTRDE